MATDKLTRIVAANVRAAMEKTGETLSSLERATGIARSTLRVRLEGNSSWKTTEMATIAAHFNTTPDALCIERVAA